MKTYKLPRGRKSQVFITVLIVLAVVLTLGVAILFHSRSFRGTSRLQIEAEQAYSLAKSGIGIGGTLISTSDPCGGIPSEVHNTYNVDGGTIKIDIYPGTGILKSTGTMGKSVRVLTKTFEPTPATEVTWAKSYDAGGIEKSGTILKTSDGGYIMEGQTDIWGSSNEDFLLIKIDPCGNIEWAKTYGGPDSELAEPVLIERIGSNTILEVNDGFVIAKSTESFGEGQYDFIMFKIDKDTGDLIWVKTYGSASMHERAHDLKDDGTGFVLAGIARITRNDDGMLVVKTNYAGDKQWARAYNTSEHDGAESIVPFQDPGLGQCYLLAGYTEDTLTRGDFRDFAVVKIKGSDPYNILAQNRYHTTDESQEILFSAIEAIDPATGNFDGFVVGGMHIHSGGNAAFIAKISTTLTIDWYRLDEGYQGGGQNLDCRDIYEDNNGNFYFVGMRNYDGLWLETNYQGAFQGMRQYGDKTSSWDHCFDIDAAGSGFILGGWYGPESTADFLAVRTDESGDISDCSTILGDDQNLTPSSLIIGSSAPSFSMNNIDATIIENPILNSTVTVNTYPDDFNITVTNLCSP